MRIIYKTFPRKRAFVSQTAIQRNCPVTVEPAILQMAFKHFDLCSTARVRVARDFLIDVIEKQRALVLGEQSRYLETH